MTRICLKLRCFQVGSFVGSGGRKGTACSVHGVTCAVMLFAGLLLIHAV